MASFRTDGVALVTGAATGIGKAAAYALAEAGAAAVLFVDIDEREVFTAAEASMRVATNPQYQAKAYVLDITDSPNVDVIFSKVSEEFSRLDYLVNSAGVATKNYELVPENDMEDYDRVLAVNSRGMLLCSRAAIKIMERQDPKEFVSALGVSRTLASGVIVNITSVMSYGAMAGKVAYIASKHASLGITKATAQDCRGKNIRVNAICPSWVRTAMFDRECNRAPHIKGFVKAAVPLGRPAEEDEIGQSIVYLCSPASSYVNGIGLIVDAGLTLTVHLGI